MKALIEQALVAWAVFLIWAYTAKWRLSSSYGYVQPNGEKILRFPPHLMFCDPVGTLSATSPRSAIGMWRSWPTHCWRLT